MSPSSRKNENKIKLDLEKNEFIQIGNLCVLAFMQKWGKEEYVYVLGVNSYPSCGEEYEVYGTGKDALSALFEGLKNLTEAANRGYPLACFFDLSMKEMIEIVNSENGAISSPKPEPMPIEHNGCVSNTHITIDKDKAYPLLT